MIFGLAHAVNLLAEVEGLSPARLRQAMMNAMDASLPRKLGVQAAEIQEMICPLRVLIEMSDIRSVKADMGWISLAAMAQHRAGHLRDPSLEGHSRIRTMADLTRSRQQQIRLLDRVVGDETRPELSVELSPHQQGQSGLIHDQWLLKEIVACQRIALHRQGLQEVVAVVH